MTDDQRLAAFGALKQKAAAAHGVALEHFLHAQSQARKATHRMSVCALRQPHSHARRIGKNHRSVSALA